MKKFFTAFILFSMTAIISAMATEPVKKENETRRNVTTEESTDLIADNAFTVPAAGMELLFDNSDEQPAIVTDMLDFAKQHMGIRYRRGGKTPAGFDCSGFTGYVFNQFGYSLGASSRDQALQGTPVDKGAVMPGDLLIFNGRAVGSRVGHVGIAIDFDPETETVTFIHSAIGGRIRIDKTSSPYYSRRYLGARRIISGNEK